MPAGAATASPPPSVMSCAGLAVRSGSCGKSARSCARPRVSSPGRPVTGELLPADRRGEATPPGLPARPCAGCVARGLLRLGVPSAVAADADRRLPRPAGPDHPRSQPWELRRATRACRAAPRPGHPGRPQAGRPVDARARLAGHPPPPLAGHHATRPAGVTSSRSCRAELHPGRSGPVVGADITQQRTGEGWLYLAVILDAFSRRVVGWSMAEYLRTELVLDALDLAISQRQPAPGLVCHSDTAASTPHSPTAAAWPPPNSSPRWGPSGTHSTTPSPRASSPPWNASSSTDTPGQPDPDCGRRSSTSSKSSTTANAATRPSTTTHPPPTSTTTHHQHPRPNHRVHGNGATPQQCRLVKSHRA